MAAVTQARKKTGARRRRPAPTFTVPEVWRTIAKKNERQGDKLFDVLVCDHAVPANDNTYRRARACPACRVKVQEYADRLRAESAPPARSARAPRSAARRA